MKYIPEDLYNEYHRQCFKVKNGNYPRRIKNFEKQKADKNKWFFFEKLAERCSQNQHINPQLLIQALAVKYEGYFDPRHLISLKGIKIYRNFLEQMNGVSDNQFIENIVEANIKFIREYCKNNNITNISDYFLENQYTMPTFILHYYNGSISKFFLGLFEKSFLLDNYPKDIVQSYLASVMTEYETIRKKIRYSKKLTKLSNNIFKVLQNVIR